jgi:hypothetical protein
MGITVSDTNAPLVEIRHRALNQRVPLQRDMILPHRCVHPGVHPQFPRSLLTRGQTLNPSSRSNLAPWPQSPRVACGSPRDESEISLLFPDHDPDRDHDSDDAITLVPSLRRSSSRCGSRNHIRGGTIELSHAPAVKRTPPTSPFGSPALPIARYHCLPLPHQPIPRRCPTPASTHSHHIPHRSINTSPKTGSQVQVKRVHHHHEQFAILSQSELKFEPSRTIISYSAYAPWG